MKFKRAIFPDRQKRVVPERVHSHCQEHAPCVLPVVGLTSSQDNVGLVQNGEIEPDSPPFRLSSGRVWGSRFWRITSR